MSFKGFCDLYNNSINQLISVDNTNELLLTSEQKYEQKVLPGIWNKTKFNFVLPSMNFIIPILFQQVTPYFRFEGFRDDFYHLIIHFFHAFQSRINCLIYLRISSLLSLIFCFCSWYQFVYPIFEKCFIFLMREIITLPGWYLLHLWILWPSKMFWNKNQW